MSEVGLGEVHVAVKPEVPSPPASEQPLRQELPKQEKSEDQVFLENSRNFGKYYTSFIGEIAGRGTEDKASFENLPLELKAEAATMTTSVRRQFIEQALRSADQKMDARALLGQVYKGPEYDALLADGSKYRLEQLSDGVFAVHVDIDLLAKLRGGAQAVAVIPSDSESVSFLMVKETLGNEKGANLDENIPHEVEHIAWRFIQRDGLVDSTESDPLLVQGFRTYQDELLARISSEGTIGGANYLNKVPRSQREKILQEHPESAKQLTETILRFGDIMEIFREDLTNSTIGKSDLILGVMQSRSFSDLEAYIIRMKSLASQNLKSQEVKPEEAQTEWSVV